MKGGASAPDAAAGFSAEELEAARDEYLREQERDLPSPKVSAAIALTGGVSVRRDMGADASFLCLYALCVRVDGRGA